MLSFFDENYQTPMWLKKKISRRNMLKSAGGATAIGAVSLLPFNSRAEVDNKFAQRLLSDPWLTIDAVLIHLLPNSESGPSAEELKITQYLYNVVYQQPTEQAEIEFIFKGVGWLNGYVQSQKQLNFIQLTSDDKEIMLRNISRSTAGYNWINNLLGYIFEGMLSPPSYGGNPEGKGWKWLNHQAGFPLPKAGKRYFELPKRAQKNAIALHQSIPSTDLLASNKPVIKGFKKS